MTAFVAPSSTDRVARTFAIVLHHRPGALDRVLGALRRQGCTVTGLAFGQTAHPAVDGLTVTFIGGDARRLRGQLVRTVDVVDVTDLSHVQTVARETALVRLAVPAERRATAESFAAAFGAHLVDHDETTVLLEITGEPARVDACIAASYVLGVRDIVRGGRVAVAATVRPRAAAPCLPFHHQADGMSETLITEQ